jgi:hypothetical protein
MVRRCDRRSLLSCRSQNIKILAEEMGDEPPMVVDCSYSNTMYQCFFNRMTTQRRGFPKPTRHAKPNADKSLQQALNGVI